MPRVFSLYLKKMSISQSLIYPIKKPSAEKMLGPPEMQASKVDLSPKVRPFCGIHVECIHITKKNAPCSRVSRNNFQKGASVSFYKYIPTFMILFKMTILINATNSSCELYSCALQNGLCVCLMTIMYIVYLI